VFDLWWAYWHEVGMVYDEFDDMIYGDVKMFMIISRVWSDKAWLIEKIHEGNGCDDQWSVCNNSCEGIEWWHDSEVDLNECDQRKRKLRTMSWQVCIFIFSRLTPVCKLGLAPEDWVPHISVGSEICMLGLASESWISQPSVGVETWRLMSFVIDCISM